MKTYAVIGCGYGDEGKGMVTHLLAGGSPAPLVVRHNGGAQAGHTVTVPGGRFVFHQLSAGSFAGAPTFWADSFFPDLFKLDAEQESFRALAGYVPEIYGDARARITTVDDVLLNMSAEILRGGKRHGSCGMGIYEAFCRSRDGWGITLAELKNGTPEGLTKKLLQIRREYLPKRAAALGIAGHVPEKYNELLADPGVLENFARGVYQNLDRVQLVESVAPFFEGYDRVIFETGQGLLLDADYLPGRPYVTGSKTDLTNPLRILSEIGRAPDRVCYVTRSYRTRHGAGPLPLECDPKALGDLLPDQTNQPNPWQGSFRVAPFQSIQDLVRPVTEDLKKAPAHTRASLIVTHLNETHGSLITAAGPVPAESLPHHPALRDTFDEIGCSYREGEVGQCGALQ